MLSCHDMYKICAQLAKAMNELDEPFGGINIIFAGDFAQLSSAIGKEATLLYSRSIGGKALSETSFIGQESAIEKALWHKVTTVVILHQNIR